ncbi:SRPBCC family protein [Mycobacterium sp. 21AC1]|uniref:SRPBCC family protein n=1 Tax=[Mycobacterium] appelbergii TaxID=2939269 RepID=UPI0029392DF8|nr:SRPBCC family protein [Mycobacterium sp. 21AC1]MDV3127262.1 SRPBCC family protein [Mycobacterium sp. 21AC1]
MQLVNEFSVDAPLDIAWSALTDIPRVVECIPGAKLEGHDGDDYRAKVAVKVGPVGLTLAGTASIVRRDDTAHEMVVRGQARDRKGNGSAEATVTMSARELDGRATVTVRTDLELGGRIAQFGSGVISQVSNRILGQFVRRLNTMITAPGEAVPSRPAPAAVAAHVSTGETDWLTVVVTALAGAVLGLAIGRTAQRLA